MISSAKVSTDHKLTFQNDLSLAGCIVRIEEVGSTGNAVFEGYVVVTETGDNTGTLIGYGIALKTYYPNFDATRDYKVSVIETDATKTTVGQPIIADTTEIKPAVPGGIAPLPPMRSRRATQLAAGAVPTTPPVANQTPPAGPAPLPAGAVAGAPIGAPAANPTPTPGNTGAGNAGASAQGIIHNIPLNSDEATWQAVPGATAYQSRLVHGGPTQPLDQFQPVPGSEVVGPERRYKFVPAVVASVPLGNRVILLTSAIGATGEGSVDVSFLRNVTTTPPRTQQNTGTTTTATPVQQAPTQKTSWSQATAIAGWVLGGVALLLFVFTPVRTVPSAPQAPVVIRPVVMESPAAVQPVATPAPARVDRSNWLASFVPTRTTNILSTAEMLDRRTHVVTRVVQGREKLELVYPSNGWLIEPLVYATVADFESAYNLGDLTSRQWVDYKMIGAPTTATTSSPTLASFGYQSFKDSSFVIQFTCRPK